MEYVDLSPTGVVKDAVRRTVRFIISTENLGQEKEGGSMARGLGFMVWVVTLVMSVVLTAPQLVEADDTKTTGKQGIDAKTAFAADQELAGTWKSQTSMETTAGHSQREGDNHKGEDSVIYKVTGAGSCIRRNPVSRLDTRDGLGIPP